MSFQGRPNIWGGPKRKGKAMKDIIQTIGAKLVAPLCGRIGTAAGAYFVGLGIDAPTVEAMQLGFVAACGVGFDLAVRAMFPKVR